jgi:hypothetical protein
MLNRYSSLDLKKPQELNTKAFEEILSPTNGAEDSRNLYNSQQKVRIRQIYATGNAQTVDLDHSSINVGATTSLMGGGLEGTSNLNLDPEPLK